MSELLAYKNIEIDKNSGFCFGVINAIKTAEMQLAQYGHLYCLGDIVHNNEELQRLRQLGLQVITHDEMQQLSHTRVLIRAHGEPPETYALARKNHIELIDATCKVVLNLQKTIRTFFDQHPASQVLMFGKEGHAEVVGLLGQTHHTGIVITSIDDIQKINYQQPARLFSQTTQNIEEYRKIIDAIKANYSANGNAELFSYVDTICHSVVHRAQQIQQFAAHYDVVIFVSGEKSSNGLYLFNICKKINSQTFFISRIEQLEHLNILPCHRIGICGATSTPMWLMQKVKQQLINNLNQ